VDNRGEIEGLPRRLLPPATPASAWIKILYDGRMSQLFVPYHSGSPRFHDVDYGFFHVRERPNGSRPS